MTLSEAKEISLEVWGYLKELKAKCNFKKESND